MTAMHGKKSGRGLPRHQVWPRSIICPGHVALNDAALHKPLGIVTLLRISSSNGAIVTGRLL
ncbi:MAG: hypothetical protein E5W93_06885 [Mesorhizobium sp.]|nr:MAG: hypothetical protein E5W93_06885 [Mesorhizobium sp.]